MNRVCVRERLCRSLTQSLFYSCSWARCVCVDLWVLQPSEAEMVDTGITNIRYGVTCNVTVHLVLKQCNWEQFMCLFVKLLYISLWSLHPQSFSSCILGERCVCVWVSETGLQGHQLSQIISLRVCVSTQDHRQTKSQSALSHCPTQTHTKIPSWLLRRHFVTSFPFCLQLFVLFLMNIEKQICVLIWVRYWCFFYRTF